jgi:nucleoside-diphosphate-sugar epimerase
MRVFVAGATGAIGRPLVRALAAKRYTVFGTTRKSESANIISADGGQPIILDVFDADAVKGAMQNLRPDVVVEQLTALPKDNTPSERRATAAMHRKIRLEGGANVHKAAESIGVARYVVQSSAFWCIPGEGLADEAVPLAVDAIAPAVASGAQTLQALETRVLQSKGMEGIVLRYGFFYGPDTWYARDGSSANQVRRQETPIIGTGLGVWSFVHVDDAAAATVSAVERAVKKSSLYNITDDRPLPVSVWLPTYARWLGAPKPPSLAEDDARTQFGEDAVFYGTKLRGVSNRKAKAELAFVPRPLEWTGENQ